MLSKSQINLLKSLQHKKFRREHGFFLVEGHKSITEFINSGYQTETIYHTAAFDPKVLKLSQKINLCEISVTEVDKISSLKTPQDVLGKVKIPQWPALAEKQLRDKFSIVLDGIQDLRPEHLHGSEFHQEYLRTAPDPAGFATLVEKMKVLDAHLPSWTAEQIRALAAPTLLVLGDADIIRPEHAVEMFRLLGGGGAHECLGIAQQLHQRLQGALIMKSGQCLRRRGAHFGILVLQSKNQWPGCVWIAVIRQFLHYSQPGFGATDT